MRIPGWLGPVIGPIVGAGAYALVCARGNLEFSLAMLAAFALIGLAAGGAMWLGDVLTRK